MACKLVEIDGAMLEGGGQILRMSIALSALLKKPIKVFNIRSGRKSPGLRPQHLTGLQLVQQICNGKLIGGNIGSTEITFHPGKIKSGKYYADPRTAGSIMLLFQVSFPCLLFAENRSELHLKGGTNAEMAPQIDHTLLVFKSVAEYFGAKFDCHILKRGYFPKGGGEVKMNIYPVDSALKPIEILEPGEVVYITGRAFVAGILPIRMADSMAHSAFQALREVFPSIPLKIEQVKEPLHIAPENGSGIICIAKTSTNCLIGGSALGKRGLRVENIAQNAAQELIDDVETGSCVDKYVQDQLIIFMALAKGKSRLRAGPLTLHTKTAIFIAEQLTEAKFEIHEEASQKSCIIECEGIGLER